MSFKGMPIPGGRAAQPRRPRATKGSPAWTLKMGRRTNAMIERSMDNLFKQKSREKSWNKG